MPISFRFSSFVEHSLLKYEECFFKFPLGGACYLPTPFFLILLIWVFSLCLLIGLDKGLSNLWIFSKNYLFVALILYIVLFVFILLIATLKLFPIYFFWLYLLLCLLEFLRADKFLV